MSIFKDEIYQGMDEITALCEPFIDERNELLASVPDEILLSKEFFLKHLEDSYGYVYQVDIPYTLKAFFPKIRDSKYSAHIYEAFKLVLIPDEEGVPTEIDMENRTVNFTAKLVKTKKIFSDQDSRDLLGKDALYNFEFKNAPVSRLNDVLELLGKPTSDRSKRNKRHTIKETLTKIMKENTWNIRNVVLSNKIVVWVMRYLNEGNMAAYTNFCKVKLMIHNDKPLYSIDEEKV
jgi:hypothetical protein